MDQKKTPLFTKLYEHYQSSPHSFHVPGHKNGRVFLEEARSIYDNILQIDQTEISGLDDLHDAKGIIDEAQQLAAHLYDVLETNFLVGGSTVGNLAMMMTVADRGDRVFVQRNSHQSVFHGLELGGVKPVFLEPEWDNATGLALGVSRETLERAVAAYGDAKAVFLTHPTYEGYGQDLRDIIRVAHEAELCVCVDEAHGAHLIFDDGNGLWPQSSLKAGADIVVQSAHKMLPAMTMASFLHINSEKVDRVKVKNYLRMLQSSSPSYPLMASLDIARAYLGAMEKKDWDRITEKGNIWRAGLESGLSWRQSPRVIGNYVQDPLKLTFVTDEPGAAKEWKERLEEIGAFPELVSPHHLLLTLPLAADKMDEDRWIPLLNKILRLKKQQVSRQDDTMQRIERISELTYCYEEMKYLPVTSLNWEKTEGYVSAETITPYPPGIPLLLKGEKVKRHHLYTMKKLVQDGASFQTGTDWIKEGLTIFLEKGNDL
ncbi:aminotransferase class I/II-fold pyridoxal phosphate-dependent enzyme [Salipaludibacillus daqingensis]|uniref:aminotransferase class I/II-fold pyridoxal phosphate-dependent enzyme n=1 Tax=Salipaludibacillus daqingensis TaxID=3041001 RepID=UPI0024759D29|nr:aminotransferase class I/II-fold pyridoxal phosphate-dependent enzyme [Salipaludibacillus daqingensis]